MDGANFETIFNKHKTSLISFFEKRGCGMESEDLVQQTFINAFNNLKSFRGETGLREWLLVIARNVWKNNIRYRTTKKADVRKVISLDVSDMEWSFPESGENPLEDLLQKERLDRLQSEILRVLTDLPPQMRQCMLLRVFQDLKYDRIAQVMKININTVKSHIYQAKKKLKDTLDLKTIEYESQNEV